MPLFPYPSKPKKFKSLPFLSLPPSLPPIGVNIGRIHHTYTHTHTHIPYCNPALTLYIITTTTWRSVIIIIIIMACVCALDDRVFKTFSFWSDADERTDRLKMAVPPPSAQSRPTARPLIFSLCCGCMTELFYSTRFLYRAVHRLFSQQQQ